MLSQNTLNQLNRRKWLRDAAIAATSVTVVPSFFIGCTDHPVNPGSGLVGAGSAPPIIEGELERAAKNIHYMIAWLDHLHTLQTDYETDMLGYIKSGGRPTGWAEFIINVILDILVGIVTAAAVAIEGVTAGVAGAAIVAGLAVTSELIKKFALPEGRPHTLDGAYTEFKTAQDHLYTSVRDALLLLADETLTEPVRYKNLRDKWTQEIDFNGKKRTIGDLAKANFPSDRNGNDYVTLQNAAMDKFKKYFWNAMIIKAGEMRTHETTWSEYWYGMDPRKLIRDLYDNNTDIPAAYFRAYYDNGWGRHHIMEYQFYFDDIKLGDKAAAELFKDDIRGRIRYPNALFDRDYVFKQFRTTKYDFGKYCDVSTEPNTYYDCSDYNFTGGILK